MHSVSEHEQDSVSAIITDDESNKRSDDNITKKGMQVLKLMIHHMKHGLQ